MQSFGTVAVVGVGLIGGSIGSAIKRRGLARQVIGIGRRQTSLDTALTAGAIDTASTEMRGSIENADLVIVCTPVGQITERVIQALDLTGPECVVTDAGSTKREIVSQVESSQHFSGGRTAGTRESMLAGEDSSAGMRFVGGHPLAGGEKSGPQFSDPNLFVDRQVILTPTSQTVPHMADRVEGLWAALGARTIRLSPADHDIAVAAVSHLPHLVAAALAGAAPREFLPLASTGWSDTTRIASGDVELWGQIFQQNREGTLKSLDKFETVLAQFREALESNDFALLKKLLDAGKKNRDIVAN